MKILMTGSTGFIGSQLVQRLREQEHEVVEMVRYIAGGRYDFYHNNKVVMADLRDRDHVEKAVLDTQPEVIVHLAAQSAVSYSFTNAPDVISTNLLGTVALAEAARQLPDLKLFINASTSEVYGRPQEIPSYEDSRLGATSPYAVSKLASEEFLRVLWDAYEFPILIMRPFNTFGRALVGNSHFVVERAITQAIETRKISLHDWRPKRDFLFRDEHVDGYVKAIQTVYAGGDLAGETLNLSSGSTWTIKDMVMSVVRAAVRIENKVVDFEFSEVPDRPLDIPILQGNGQKALEMIGWEASTDLDSKIERAYDEWYNRLKFQQ